MEQILDLADDRLVGGCIFCGDSPDTRDHVPSKVLLNSPYPENLPVVGACKNCNQQFSKDEQYLACFLESVFAGSTDPDAIKHPSIARAMRRAPALRARIEAAKSEVNGQVVFAPEEERIKNVMLKHALGHAAFELSQLMYKVEPTHYWCDTLSSLDKETQDAFNAVHFQKLLGEVGSRNIQRMFVTEVQLQSENGDQKAMQLLVNDWVDVQDGRYRYLAIDDSGYTVIRIVVAEYLACEVGWEANT